MALILSQPSSSKLGLNVVLCLVTPKTICRVNCCKGTKRDIGFLTAKKMHKDHGMSINDICKILKISRASFYRYIAL